MTDTAPARESWSERHQRLGGTIEAKVTERIPAFDRETLERVTRMLLAETGYLWEHLPELRQSVAPFACSDETYHLCSCSTQHDAGCPAVGGDGKPQGAHWVKPCPEDCGEKDAEEWCQVSGFGCPTCELVDNLLGILAATEAPIATSPPSCPDRGAA